MSSPRKAAILVCSIIAVVGIAFVSGALLQRYSQVARIRAAENLAREMTGLNDPVPSAPAWENWHYPRGKWKANRPGIAVRISGELVRPAGFCGLMVTPDPFEDVARFYAEKIRFGQPDQIAKSRSAVFDEGNLQGESIIGMDDDEYGADSGRPRPLKSKCLVRRCASYDMTIFLTRADDEPYTHILLVYHPRTETSLAKR